jgi:hypothetical protein
MKKHFLFVAGCPRSGTSVLARVLAAHPDIALGIERYNLRIAKHQLQPSDFERKRFFNVQPGDTWYTSLADRPHYKSLRAKYDAVRYVGDKYPGAYEHYTYLQERFPEARFIFIIRNILDVALSFEQRLAEAEDWPADRDATNAVTRWNESISHTLRWRDRCRILTVCYEDLFVRNGSIQAIASFLGVTAQPLEEALGGARAVPRRDTGRAARLPPEKAEYICKHADFAGFRLLLGMTQPRVSSEGDPAANTRSLAGARAPAPTGKKYQDEDNDLIDYRYYQLPGTDKCFRGPPPDFNSIGRGVSFLGAASCFGRYVRHPYPELVGKQLDREVCNFGYGGVRAPFYYRDAVLMQLINRSALVVIEVFSSRGAGTTRVEARGDASALLRWTGTEGPFVFADRFFRELWTASPARMHALAIEIRERYLEQMHSLLSRLHVPVVLLWFSQRSPDENCGYTSPESYESSFPHLVDRATLNNIAQDRVEVVEVVSRAGLPQELGPRLQSTNPATARHRNDYYPSAEMHQLAADRLTPVISRMLSQ